MLGPKEKVLDAMNALKIAFALTEHPAVFTIEACGLFRNKEIHFFI